jgi:DHA1 family bicyclomycin/chloramphenicol resistance-like MFS transporter
LVERPLPHPIFVAGIGALAPMGLHTLVPALPIMAIDLDVPASTVQHGLTVYVLGMGAGQLIYGPISDRFGRRPTLVAGLLIFVATMIAGALAGSAESLVLWRLLQALGGCAGLVLGRAMVRDTTSSQRAVGQMALLNFAMSGSIAVAPAIGSYVTAWFGWRAIFWAFALGGLIATYAALRLPETHKTREGGGFIAMFRGAAILSRNRVFWGYVVAGSAASSTIYAFLAASPFLFIDVLHRPPEEAGIYYLLILVGTASGAVIANRLSGRMPIHTFALRANFGVLVGSSLLMLADRTGQLTIVTMMAPMVIYALSMGASSPNCMAGALSADPRLIGAASGLYGFIQMMQGALATFVVSQWHDGTALPPATVLLVSAIVGQIALRLGGPVRA